MREARRRAIARRANKSFHKKLLWRLSLEYRKGRSKSNIYKSGDWCECELYISEDWYNLMHLLIHKKKINRSKSKRCNNYHWRALNQEVINDVWRWEYSTDSDWLNKWKGMLWKTIEAWKLQKDKSLSLED